jgi:hypothetical protein
MSTVLSAMGKQRLNTLWIVPKTTKPIGFFA